MSITQEDGITTDVTSVNDDYPHNMNVIQEDSKASLSEDEKQKLLERIRGRRGSAPIKEDFIDLQRFHQLYGVSAAEEPPHKKQKLKGQNKVRPRTKWIPPSEKLCPNLSVGSDCQFGDKCKFSHDVADCMAKKLPDLGPKCYNFDMFGYCPFGLSCRFGSSHISQSFENVADESRRVDVKDLTSNNLSPEMKQKLRQRSIKFPKSEVFLKSLPAKGKKKGHMTTLFTSKSDQEKVFTSEVTKTEASFQVNSDPSSLHQDTSERKKPVDSEGSNHSCSKSIKVPCSSTGDGGVSETALTAAGDVPSTNSSSADEVSERIQDSSKGPEKQNQTMHEKLPISDTVSTNTPKSYLEQIGLSSKSRTSFYRSSGSRPLRTPPREIKQLDVKGKLLLAPLTTVGNLPFRRICKRFGADITCGEMAMCTNLLMGQGFEWALLRRHHTEDVFGVQLCGAYPDTMSKCAEMVSSHLNVDFIDVNVGCPIDLVYKKGAGSGLMNRMSKFEEIVRGMSTVMDIPLTVKMRMGLQENKNVAHTLIPKLYDWGASVVMVHGRSKDARYTKSADWDYLKTCAEAADPYPFVGNGDILSFEDANEHFSNSGSAGLMIARGALIKPWIFTEIKEQRHWDISASERLDILRDFTNYGLENWGSDTQGVDKTRRFLLEWLSFLHRYIPVGIMERMPQRINERPPYYFGRSDLETLMSSANCADWIKISEMLLGPIPDDFSFLPKHKANSYK